MDKFQAIRYLVSVAEAGSFSAAARSLGVTTSAVKKLVNALEHDLRCPLIQPRSRGVALTTDGLNYYQRCRSLLQDFAVAESEVAGSSRRPSGVLKLGLNPSVAANCVMPALPGFRARYPEIEIDSTMTFSAGDASQELDVLVLMAWPSAPGFIQRRLAETRFVACASPEYWARTGMPKDPRDLARHACVNFRARVGTVLDRWVFERGEEIQQVDMRGFVVSNDRNALLEIVLGGAGVIVTTDLTTQRELRDGSLVPVLLDWRIKHAPPIDMLFRANQRHLPRVRLFVDFMVELFRDLDARRVPMGPVPPGAEPAWMRTGTGRASTAREELKP